MRHGRKQILSLLLAGVCLATAALARDVPASNPADDHSAPEKTWAAMCAAIKAGNLQAFRACCYNHNEISRSFMDAYSDTLVTAFQLATGTEKLGDEGKTLSKSLQSTYQEMQHAGENRRTEIDGDEASWIQTEKLQNVTTQKVIYFRKKDGQWLMDTNRSYALDTAEGRKAAEDFIASSAPQLKLLKSVVADMQSGKITTVDALRQRLAAKPQ